MPTAAIQMFDKHRQGASALPLLRTLMPPRTLIHVGAGSGAGPLHQWHDWPIPHVWLIDANASRLDWVKKQGDNATNWQVREAILDEHPQTRPYYNASNPDEAGLVEPEQLRGLWPGLKTKASNARETQRLDTLLNEAGDEMDGTWLLVDCLPALPVLKGAGDWLDACNVVWLRVLLQPLEGVDNSLCLDVMEQFLLPFGFVCVELSEGNHPLVGHALFARDWKQVLGGQVQALSQQQQELAHQKLMLEQGLETQKQQLQQLTKARDEEAWYAGERLEEVQRLTTALEGEQASVQTLQGQLEKMTGTSQEQVDKIGALGHKVQVLTQQVTELGQQKTELETAGQAQRQQSQAEIAQLVQARDEQQKLAGERQTRIQQLTKARDEQAELAANKQLELERLTKAHEELVKLAADRHAHIQKITQAHDGQAGQVSKLQEQLEELTGIREQQSKQIATLEGQVQDTCKSLSEAEGKLAEMQAELTERDIRQQMLNDEMTRAEAQIDLIKDVLFREPSL